MELTALLGKLTERKDTPSVIRQYPERNGASHPVRRDEKAGWGHPLLDTPVEEARE